MNNQRYVTKSSTVVIVAAWVLALPSFFCADLHAQMIISANDRKAQLVDGVTTIAPNSPPDTVTFIDPRSTPAKIVANIDVPNSVVGPPQNVAITPDKAIVLVASSTKVDPADPTKTVPDDRVTVIDMQSSPPKVLTTLRAGSGASGVAINRAGTVALVANRYDGSVSVFAIKGKTVTPNGKVSLGAPDSQPSGIAITPDGRTALVTRNNDNLISLLSLEGGKVSYDQRTIEAGLKPYGIEITPNGRVAIVGNVGAGQNGGPDTVSVIDLAATTPRAVNHITVGPTAEGVALSPDGQYVAVTVMNGTNAPKSSPSFNDFGRLRIFALKDTSLSPVAEAKIGHWCQGVAWTGDSRTVFAQCMIEREILSFGFDGRALSPGASIKIDGGPAGILVTR